MCLLEGAFEDVHPAHDQKTILSGIPEAGCRPVNGGQALPGMSSVTFWLRHYSVVLLNGIAARPENTRASAIFPRNIPFLSIFRGICGVRKRMLRAGLIIAK